VLVSPNAIHRRDSGNARISPCWWLSLMLVLAGAAAVAGPEVYEKA